MGYSVVPTVATGDLWTAANHNTYIKDNFAAHQQMLNDIPLVKISETVLTSITSEIVFSNIPSTLRHLKLLVFGRTNSTGFKVFLQFNGDTGNNYEFAYEHIVNAADFNYQNIIDNKVLVGYLSTNSQMAGMLGMAEVNIPEYTQQSFFKVVKSIGANNEAAGSASNNSFGFWKSTNAINSIRVFPLDGSFLVGSTFTLYGYL